MLGMVGPISKLLPLSGGIVLGLLLGTLKTSFIDGLLQLPAAANGSVLQRTAPASASKMRIPKILHHVYIGDRSAPKMQYS